MRSNESSRDVDAYVASFPAEVQEKLEAIRSAIRRAVPDADETIKYGMPTFTLHGDLIYFGAFKQHIALYPRLSAIEAFRDRLEPYEVEKGTVRLPLNQSIPLDLIARIAAFRADENRARAIERAKR